MVNTLAARTGWTVEHALQFLKEKYESGKGSMSPTSVKKVMKCAIAESYTHIGQAQIDKSEVKNRASEEHNRRGNDHTGTPVRERELRVILELTWYTS